MPYQILCILIISVAFSILISFLASLLVHFLIEKLKFNSKIRRLPQGPLPLPLVGNALSLLGGFDRVLQLMHIYWPRTYGEIFVTYIGTVCNVNITSPELMEPILKSQKIIDKGNIYNLFRPWIGDGLVISTGSKWKTRRRLLTPAFHFQTLEKFINIFNEHSLILCQLLDQRLDTQKDGMEINVYPLVANCTLDSICETAMGVSINAQFETSDYVRAVYRINQIIIDRFSKPWLTNGLIFPLTPAGREHKRLLNTLHSFTQKVISERRKKLRTKRNIPTNYFNSGKEVEENGYRGKRYCRALLDILLEFENDEDSTKLTDKDIQEEIDTFMFEGHDTTASAVSWFLYCMADNPEHQERVWDELQEIFGDSPRYCTQEDLNYLTYLDCCMKETLRLYPSAPHIERYLKEDLQIGEYLIPSGANIIMLIYGMHHNPRLYPNPFTFDPSKHFEDRPNFSYIPFSAGSRNCIGQRYALIEVKVVVSNILRRFKVSLSPLSARPIPSMQAILKPLNGINLVVSPR